MSKPFHISVYTHGVRVYDLNLSITVQLKPFLDKFTQRETVEHYDFRSDKTTYETVVKKKYYVLTEDGKELFIHRNCLEELLASLKTLGLTNYVLHEHEVPDDVVTDIKTIASKVPRDYQEVIIKSLVDGKTTRNVCLGAGGGKTFCALKAMEVLKSRTILMLLPKYFGLWEKAIREDISSNPTIEYVKGYKALIDIIERAVNGGQIADIIFMSATTYRSYIECLERYGTEGMKEIGYVVPPYEFHKALGIGIQINDEIQDDPGLYFRIDTLLNVKKEIFLTATPYTGDERLSEMIRVMMPEGCDVPIPEASKYTHVVAIRYNDLGVRTGDYRGYKGAYSHINYESSILKNKGRREAYFSKVARVVQHFFVKEYQDGQKMIIYCSTKAFILALVKYLQKKFPERTVTEYIGGVDFKEILVNDIVVTTIKSAGAGVDIPNLKEALMLVATNSKKDNIQAMRRPRPLVNYDNLNPRFSYFVCNQIPKHLGYGQNRKGFFAPFAMTHVERLIR